MNKAICGSKESAAPHDELGTWKETVLVPTLARYPPNDIYNGDETALFYKSLPHRTYFDGDKPEGSAKHKDRLTLLIITNMDGSDQRKLSVIGKSKTPHCLQKKYKMQVMSVDWYASKNAWMTSEIHHQIMTKLNTHSAWVPGCHLFTRHLPCTTMAFLGIDFGCHLVPFLGFCLNDPVHTQ